MEGSIIRSSIKEENEEDETLLNPHREEQIVHRNINGSSQNGNKTSQEPHQQQNIPFRVKTARSTIYVLGKALNIAYVPLFIYRLFERSRKCTPVTDPFLRIPAVELARQIRRKEVSCEQVIQAYISRIKEVNPLLNAVVEERFEDALEDARRVDTLVSTEDFLKDENQVVQDYPLLGVPITIKGSIAVKGMKHTSGSLSRKDITAESDADTVLLARKAGAIPLLVSNVPEFCMSWETTNKLIGTTRNPHDTTRTCGGSSGGEGSLLGAGASLLGIGSDIAGSLRLPAHYCGVWGHKPTPGAVSFDGHYPSCPHRDKWGTVFTVGPMSRYAADLRTLLEVISIPEKRNALNLNRKIDIKQVKVLYSEHEDFYWKNPNSDCVGAVKKVVNHFRDICDIKPKKIDLHLSDYMPDMASLEILTIEDIDGCPKNVCAELFRYTTFRSQYTFMALACGLLQKFASSLTEKQKTSIKKSLAKVKTKYEEMLKDNAVLIVPSFPVEAPKHGDVFRTAMYSGYMSMFNMLGFPVTNCPVGVTKDGLPVGVQVASLPYDDNLTLTVAEEIEKAFGGWIEPRDS